jgi:xanthine phosphoribosyltransferase
MTAMQMKLPMVTLKKQSSKILNDDIYQTTVHSYTKGSDYELTLSKQYISKDDNILIIDDFLANGEAALGAARLVETAGATVAGIGIVIEKAFQNGSQILKDKGYDVYSLARIAKLSKGNIEFVK